MSQLRPKAIREVSTGTPETDRVQEELAHKLKALQSCPLLFGVSVTAVLRPNVTEKIDHKLGRQPQGFIVLDLTGNFGPAIQRMGWDTKTITLVHGGAANLTVKLWVF